MKVNWIKIILNLVITIGLVLKIGFAVTEAANPVTLLISEEGTQYVVSIDLSATVSMQSLQFRLTYDGTKLKLADENAYSFDASFKKKYNGNGSAILTTSSKNEGKNSSVLFLGVQADENYAVVQAGANIADVVFEMAGEAEGAVAKALALASISLDVEVLENSKGNLVTEEESMAKIVYGTGLEHLNKTEFDENRFTEVEGGDDSNQNESSQNNNSVNTQDGVSETESVTDKNENKDRTNDSELKNSQSIGTENSSDLSELEGSDEINNSDKAVDGANNKKSNEENTEIEAEKSTDKSIVKDENEASIEKDSEADSIKSVKRTEHKIVRILLWSVGGMLGIFLYLYRNKIPFLNRNGKTQKNHKIDENTDKK